MDSQKKQQINDLCRNLSKINKVLDNIVRTRYGIENDPDWLKAIQQVEDGFGKALNFILNLKGFKFDKTILLLKDEDLKLILTEWPEDNIDSRDLIRKYNRRNGGSVIFPNGRTEIIIQPVRPAEGFESEIYCKDCHKNVKPALSGINQIICSVCGYGLTPDFFSLKNLKRWMEGDDSAKEDDLKSPEAKAWFKKHDIDIENATDKKTP